MQIAGVGVTGYNGTFTILSVPTPTTFTYTDTLTGLANSGGGTATLPLVVSGETLTLSGTGINNTGALLDTGGNSTWQAPIILADNPVLLSPTGTPETTPPANVSIGTTNLGDTLTINGVLSQESPLTNLSDSPLALLKVGSGRVTLAQADTYTGFTTVVAGALRIQNANALGNPLGSVAIAASPVGAVETAGTTTVTITTTTAPATAFAVGQSVQITGVGVAGYNGVFTIRSVISTTQFTYTSAQMGLAASGGGTATLANGVLVDAGAALELDGDPTGVGASLNVANKPLTLNGQGVNGTGALLNVSGNNIFGDNITLQTNAAIGANPSGSLTVTGAVQDSVPEVQQILIAGAAPAAFRLTFNGQTSPGRGPDGRAPRPPRCRPPSNRWRCPPSVDWLCLRA